MSLLLPGFRLGGEVHLAQQLEGASVWACLKTASQEGASRSRSGASSNPKPPTLPTELTGARRDCGCPDAQAQARCCDKRAWASSADLGRSLAPVQSLFPLNSPSPFTHLASHIILWYLGTTRPASRIRACTSQATRHGQGT